MERVLSSAELLGLIFDELCWDRATLSRCTRVRSCWFDVAARRLWRYLDNVDDLFQLLPVIKRGPYRRLMFTHSDADWARFHVYAKYVRRLDFFTKSSGLTPIQPTISQLAYRGSIKCLLPQLEDLHVTLDVDDVLDCIFFVHNGLRRLSVDDLDDSLAVHNFFCCILPIVPNIKFLSIAFDRDLNPTHFDEDLPLAIKRLVFLEEFTVEYFNFTPSVLLALATLPRLKCISLNACRSPSKSEMEELNGSFQNVLKGIDSPFSSLERVSHSSNMAAFSRFLCMRVLLPSIIALCATVEDDVTEVSLQRCSERIGAEWSNLSILHFSIDAYAGGKVLPFNVLRPLLSLHKMQSFDLHSVIPPLITDDELDSLASSWPLLETFGIYSTPDESIPLLTLSAVMSFAQHCKKMKSLTLNVDATSVPSVPSGTPVMKNMKMFNFRFSPLADPDAIALYLYKLFTPACRYEPGAPSDPESLLLQRYKNGWNRVWKSLQLIITVTNLELRE